MVREACHERGWLCGRLAGHSWEAEVKPTKRLALPERIYYCVHKQGAIREYEGLPAGREVVRGVAD